MMYVARNKDGWLHLWTNIPRPPERMVHGEIGKWHFSIDFGHHIPGNLFPQLKWEDEPLEVELISRNEGMLIVDELKLARAIWKNILKV